MFLSWPRGLDADLAGLLPDGSEMFEGAFLSGQEALLSTPNEIFVLLHRDVVWSVDQTVERRPGYWLDLLDDGGMFAAGREVYERQGRT